MNFAHKCPVLNPGMPRAVPGLNRSACAVVTSVPGKSGALSEVVHRAVAVTCGRHEELRHLSGLRLAVLSGPTARAGLDLRPLLQGVARVLAPWHVCFFTPGVVKRRGEPPKGPAPPVHRYCRLLPSRPCAVPTTPVVLTFGKPRPGDLYHRGVAGTDYPTTALKSFSSAETFWSVS